MHLGRHGRGWNVGVTVETVHLAMGRVSGWGLFRHGSAGLRTIWGNGDCHEGGVAKSPNRIAGIGDVGLPMRDAEESAA